MLVLGADLFVVVHAHFVGMHRPGCVLWRQHSLRCFANNSFFFCGNRINEWPDTRKRIYLGEGPHKGRGGLSMSRALGDKMYKLKPFISDESNPLVTPEPELRVHTVDQADQWCILASDGSFVHAFTRLFARSLARSFVCLSIVGE